jgi:hypothetical protein
MTRKAKSKHPMYPRWCNMKARCNNPKATSYKDYGGRGILVCERWADFFLFLEDMGNSWKPELLLDRIDNDGNYTPENCRWVSRSVSNKNTRVRGEIPFRGVKKSKSQRYTAMLHLGEYDTAEKASAAYERAVRLIAKVSDPSAE